MSTLPRPPESPSARFRPWATAAIALLLAHALTISLGTANTPAARAEAAATALPPATPDWWTPLGLRSLDGAPATFPHAPAASGRWLVGVFLAPECPVTNQYLPVLAQLSRDFAAHGVTVLGVYCDPEVPAATLQAHARDYAIPFPVVIDPAQRFVALAGATYTPEVVVLSPGAEVRYRGRIDDRVGGFGAARPAAVHNDLRDALEALLAGKIPGKNVAGFGCDIHRKVGP